MAVPVIELLEMILFVFFFQHKYHFDEVFSESCKNEEVYARTAKPLISTMFNR